MVSDTTGEEPERLKEFRRYVVRVIPRLPNDKISRESAERASLRELMLDYVNWSSKFVPARPRRIGMNPWVPSQPSWSKHLVGICGLLATIERGDNLKLYQSPTYKSAGHVPQTKAAKIEAGQRWIDKDFVWTKTGWHHFHIGTVLTKNTDYFASSDVLFAEVSRMRFYVKCILGHDVFILNSPEMLKLDEILETELVDLFTPGFVVLRPPLAA